MKATAQYLAKRFFYKHILFPAISVSQQNIGELSLENCMTVTNDTRYLLLEKRKLLYVFLY